MSLRPANISAFDSEQQRTIEDIYDLLSGAAINTNSGVIHLINRSGQSAVNYLDRQLQELNQDSLPSLQTSLEELNDELEGKFPITETDISDDSISTPKLKANAVTADKILANTITANEIEADTITANEIESNTITANEIDVGNLFAQSIELTGSISNSNGDYVIDADGIQLINTLGSKVTGATITFKSDTNTNLEIYALGGGSSFFLSRGDFSFQRNGTGVLNLRETYADFEYPVGLPSYTDTQRDNLSSPVVGWIIYNSTADGLQLYTAGSGWQTV